jgi:hypothetical protein
MKPKRSKKKSAADQNPAACSCGFESAEVCHNLFEAILEKEFSDFRYARVHRLTVDAYSLQHPDRYMISAKSFAAHLTGMCCAMEHDGDRDLLHALQQWLSGKSENLEKPPIPARFGNLTIAHPAAASDGDDHARRVQEWAAGVWKAWDIYHELARIWIAEAAQGQRKR